MHPTNSLFFFFNDTATTEIYTLSLHDALPISEDVTPQTGVPAAVRGPIPTDGSYVFSRLFVDFRRYTRVSPSGRVHLRGFAGRRVGGGAAAPPPTAHPGAARPPAAPAIPAQLRSRRSDRHTECVR